MAETRKSIKESLKARQALDEYLLMGPDRTLAKLAEVMGKRPGYVQLLKEWSSAHKWQEKAREYDKEQAAARRRAIEEARREMDKEHALWGKEQALLAIQTIQGLIAEGKYNPAAANQLFKIATDLQRLAMGSATEQIALTGKDGGAVEMDVIVETFWGRGTDPRRNTEHILDEPRLGKDPAETIEEDQGDAEDDAEFGINIPDDDE